MRAFMVRGSDLSEMYQREALRRFVYRPTIENRATHARINPTFTLRLLSDAEWLTHTFFAMRKRGGFDERVRYCQFNHPDYRLDGAR